MAQKVSVTLNPQIESIEKGSKLDQLYTSFVDMTNRANSVEVPDFTADPPMLLDEDGNQIYDSSDPCVPLVDVDYINSQIKEYKDIQIKNYSYDLANSIISTLGSGENGEGGSGGGAAYLPIAGGSMSGRLAANYGVELGDSGKTLINITHDGNNNPIGYFYLPMKIDGDVSIDGSLAMADEGIWFHKHQSIFVNQETLTISYSNILIEGATTVEGTLTIGDIIVDGDNGITINGNEYYHAGNSNNAKVDWNANNMHVYGNLQVDGALDTAGRLKALYGFDLGEEGERYFYSSVENGKTRLWLGTDLTILGYDNGIKFDEHYIIKTRSADHNVISICAPGRTLNLGDTDLEALPTNSVALQANFNTADNAITLITPLGKGFFRGFSATAVDNVEVANNQLVQGSVIATYVEDNKNKGVVFRNRVTLFSPSKGPSLYSENGNKLTMLLPFTYLQNDVTYTDMYLWDAQTVPTTSPFADPQSSAPTIDFDSDAQFFAFSKPVESDSFSIKLGKHQTRLTDGVLFLDNNKVDGSPLFLEAVGNTIFHSGNATFNHSLSSKVFTSGLAGYGWAIMENSLNGNFHATFDELTVRKTFRTYSMEVQKQNVTNGSWWVTDSCSGDSVELVS